MTDVTVSIIIVTKDRAQTLKHCLGSLAAQTVKPEELIIINNNSQDATTNVVSNFSKTVEFPVRVYKEKRSLYPVIYNRGLKESSGDWALFIDDDCVAESGWFETFHLAIDQAKETAVFLGNCRTYDEASVFSLSAWILDELWKYQGRDGTKIKDFTTLDNKNIAYNKEFLEKNQIRFDQKRTAYQGAAEDADLGLQIKESQGQAKFLPEATVYHKDPDEFLYFWKKVIRSQQAFNTLYSKWPKRWLQQCRETEKRAGPDKRMKWEDWLKYTDVTPSDWQKRQIQFLLWSAGMITNKFINYDRD
jgi:glycosyltransferase involved in cell wall biosynthesis